MKNWRMGLALSCALFIGQAAFADLRAGSDGLDDLTKLKPGRAMRASTNAEPWQISNADARPIQPGETLTLAELKGPGVIGHIWNTVAAPEKGYSELLVLRMYWDGETSPSVEAPLGDFFGVGHGMDINLDSLPVRVTSNGRGRNCYWATPFAKSARITVTNEGKMEVASFYAYIDWRTLPKLPKNTAYFHAMYRQEFPAIMGQRYLLADIVGRGHYVGTALSVHQRTASWFGEGDDFFFVDGEKEPSLRGTGTEDYFCDGWGFREQSGPYYGAPLFEGSKAGDLTSVYRWHITDPIVFQKSLRAEIEHTGPVTDSSGETLRGYGERGDDFASVAFWYQTEPHKPWPALPAGYERLRYGKTVIDGILSSDRPADWKANQLRILFEENYLYVCHGAVSATTLDQLTVQIPFFNDASTTLRAHLATVSDASGAIQPASVDAEIPALAKQDINLKLTANPPVPLAQASFVDLVWKFSYAAPDGENIEFTANSPCSLDAPFGVQPAKNPIIVDGDLGEWGALPFVARYPAQRLSGADAPGTPSWRGPEDAMYHFDVRRDDAFVYVAVAVRDDDVVSAPGVEPWAQDGVEIRIDARPKEKRNVRTGRAEPKEMLFVALSPSDRPDPAYVFAAEQWPAGTKGVCVKTAGGYNAEIAVPAAYLDQQQGKAWGDFRFNVCVDDADKPETTCVQLWWRPDWRTKLAYPEAGLFVRE